MWRLLLRNLLDDPARTLLSILGLAAAVMLVLVFEGFSEGLYAQLRAYPERVGADLVVLRAGVRNLAAATSALPQSTRAELEATPGVERVHPLGGLPLIYEANGQRTPIYVVAFEDKGGPPVVVEGGPPEPGRRVVIDAGLADKYELGVGDEVELAGERFVVAGITTGAAALFTPYVFVRIEDLIDIAITRAMETGDAPANLGVGFYLVDLAPAAQLEDVGASIERRLPAVDVLAPAEIAANDVQMGRRMMGGVMQLLVVVAYVIALLVVVIVLSSSVLARARELGTLKAVGASTPRLIVSLGLEASLLMSVAFVVGAAAAAAVAAGIEAASPMYLVTPWVPGALLRTAAGALLISWVGAAMPAHRIGQLDPAEVFAR